MKPTPKPKTVARRYWTYTGQWKSRKAIACFPKASKTACENFPVLVIPLTPEATAKAVEAMRVAIGMELNTGKGWKIGQPYGHAARRALEALCGKLPK